MKIEWIEIELTNLEQMIVSDQVGAGLAALNNLLYDEPGYARLHNHLGWAYANYTENEERAELHLKMAIRFEESYEPPYLHLASLYIRQGRYGDAMDCSEDGLVKCKSRRVSLLQYLASACELRKDWGKAIKAYKDALMESVAENESSGLHAGIKRCRRKRMMVFLGL